MIHIYTDGACEGNPGRGGWGAVIVEDGNTRPFSGSAPRTTNNRMELQAAIEGLAQTPKGAAVTVHSDSQYLVNTMARGWKRNANPDLWAALDRLAGERSVAWQWVKGHAGHPYQEEANRLAQSFSRRAQQAAGTAEGGKAQAPEAASPGQSASGGPAPPKALSHVDAQGQARMVDVSAKGDTERVAMARGSVVMEPSTLELVRKGQAAKGDVLAVARVAGIMGAKRTAELIPLCHPLLLTDIDVEFAFDDAESAVEITATAKTMGRTGAEMEALTAVAISALTIYDMCKAVDRRMRMQGIRLVRKSGGKSGPIVLE